ncbi:MAG: tetratricopeptide repeat protein [Planctomycetes bacterium]|nr:tetratricopeptide repeat protein [Planctomycetota bacterium]
MFQNPHVKLVAIIVVSFSSITSVRAEPIDEKVEKGRRLLNTEQHQQGVELLEGAASELKAIVLKTPTDSASFFTLGKVSFYTGRDREAAKYYDEAIRLAPNRAKYHFMRGILAKYMKETQRAETALERATELAPQVPQYWYEWGEVLTELGRVDPAKMAFRHVLTIDPKNTDAMFALAYVFEDASEDSEAISYYERIVKQEPENVAAHYNVGQSFQTLGKYEPSLAAFRRVIALTSDDWRAHAKIVQNLEALARFKERDQARGKLLELWERDKDKIDAKMYCRDQFETADHKVLVLEYFEFKGEMRVRYSFRVSSKASNEHLYRISLGSYDVTHEHAQNKGAVGKGKRFCHLDRYYPNDAHETFGFFDGEPSYDKTKALVIKIIKGLVEPQSSMTPDPNDHTPEAKP